MNKVLLLSLAAAICFGASAQLKIEKGGYAVFGKNTGITFVNPTFGTTKYTPTPVDTLANATFLGHGPYNGGGYIAFGPAGGVKIGEVEGGTTAQTTQQMLLSAPRGFIAEAGDELLFACARGTYTGFSSFRSYLEMRAPSFIVDSDSRLKSNISTLKDSFEGLYSITPVSYTLNTTVVETEKAQKLSAEDTMKKLSPVEPDSRTRFGFIAQEVQTVFPDLVVEDEDGVLGIDYIGFIPVLVDAVKSLRAEVAEQKKVIESLTTPQRRNAPTAGISELTDDTPALGQNRPNPFTTTTNIECLIPESVANAALYIYDLQGKQLRNITITDRGATTLTIEADKMDAGMYIYSLILDGAEIDSKRFIVSK